MTKKISVVLAGISGYGQGYLIDLLSRHGRDIHLAGLVDPYADNSPYRDQIAEKGITIFDSLEAFYAQHTADLAVLSSPIAAHAPQTILALERGSNVLCEKPVAATVQDAQAMIAARNKTDRFVAVGYQWSFAEPILSLKRDILRGDFGKPVRLKCYALWPRTDTYYNRNNWAGGVKNADGQWILDSPANNATAHYLHHMFFMTGDAINASSRPLSVTGQLYRANPIDNFDSAMMKCTTDVGADILFYTIHAVQNVEGPVYDMTFENGCVQYRSSRSMTATMADGSVRVYGDPNAANRNGKLWECVAAVQDRRTLPCGLETALSQTIAVNGLQDAAAVVQVDPAHVHVTKYPEKTQTWIDGIAEVVRRCYAENRLPQTHDAPWVVDSAGMDLSNYTAFAGSLVGAK